MEPCYYNYKSEKSITKIYKTKSLISLINFLIHTKRRYLDFFHENVYRKSRS